MNKALEVAAAADLTGHVTAAKASWGLPAEVVHRRNLRVFL